MFPAWLIQVNARCGSLLLNVIDSTLSTLTHEAVGPVLSDDWETLRRHYAMGPTPQLSSTHSRPAHHVPRILDFIRPYGFAATCVVLAVLARLSLDPLI